MLRTHHVHTLTALSLSSDTDTGQDITGIQPLSMRERKLESQQHSDSARRQAKEDWHPDRCGFFDRSVTGFGPCAGAGAAAWRICACCHCTHLAGCAIPSSNACAPRNIGSTSRVLRVRDLGQWIGAIVYVFQEPRMPFMELAFQAGEAQCHNPFGC
jgi:hypothetical protein